MVISRIGDFFRTIYFLRRISRLNIYWRYFDEEWGKKKKKYIHKVYEFIEDDEVWRNDSIYDTKTESREINTSIWNLNIVNTRIL